MDILKNIAAALEKGEAADVERLTKEAVAADISAKEILDDGLIAGMKVVGDKFKVHEIFLPEVLMAAKAMYAGMDEIKPLLIRDNVPTIGRVVIGSVKGDLHDIGKNLVAIMLKGAGFEIIDLGADVPPEKFIEAARNNDAGVIGMSALLTTTMTQMKTVVDMIKEQGMAGKVRVIIGGAPVNENYRREIGADAYAFDGVSAVEKVKQLLGLES